MLAPRYRTLGLFIVGLLTAALSLSAGGAAQPTTSDGPFDAKLREAAKDYLKWGRVDDELRWAPFLCRLPMPAVARFSASDHAQTHGQKLYSLFAKDRTAYVALGNAPLAVGQAIVKQSWVPEEIPDDGKPLTSKAERRPSAGSQFGDTFVPYARRDGKLFKAAKQSDLFVMLKLDPKTPGSDQGWVYGTVTHDGVKVTSAGRVESCMRCHAKAKHDRLFGLGAAP